MVVRLKEALERVWLSHMLEPHSDETLTSMAARLKQYCPGNYHLTWMADERVNIVFDDPEEELLWKLRWE